MKEGDKVLWTQHSLPPFLGLSTSGSARDSFSNHHGCLLWHCFLPHFLRHLLHTLLLSPYQCASDRSVVILSLQPHPGNGPWLLSLIAHHDREERGPPTATALSNCGFRILGSACGGGGPPSQHSFVTDFFWSSTFDGMWSSACPALPSLPSSQDCISPPTVPVVLCPLSRIITPALHFSSIMRFRICN